MPRATVDRLPRYLRALDSLEAQGVVTTSSVRLSAVAGVGSAQLRKDLSFLGSHGRRGVGYDVSHLRGRIAAALGVTSRQRVVIVGIGNLGHALANYSGFGSRGFRVAGLIDSDPERIGEKVGDLEIAPLEALAEIVRDGEVSIGVIAAPEANAQDVCDRLVAAGVRSILNFAPTVLAVPPEVDVRKVDLSIELQILAYHEQRKAGSAAEVTA